ncbi:hypothetical protein CYLTODRAFT_486791 [Cylindrobasidium torrendii FP15055 ss-10]|uniref:F-box domain-containing protein n=1 Tax=Cylindrobasidium torrendii FP15055 ss-10 TaxID=1314674 RepID=A0A0D7BN77_9AGAR|nr:hypothetical protein CYLTODRAFT_486791 [Cylindrobasidium torrendii FP15055 ss-10]
MAWKPHFETAMKAFRENSYNEALSACTEAIDKSGSHTPYYIIDCRSAINEKLGKLRDALLDAKRVIDLAPTRWQGYSRSARLFHRASKFDQCISMAEMAIARLDKTDTKRREEMATLISQAEQDRKQRTCYIVRLPVELLVEAFQYLVQADAPTVLIISAVCSHWRKIAIETQVLWDTLTLTGKHPKRKTALWLARAKGRFRVINLRLTCLPPNWTSDLLDQGVRWDCLRECRQEDWDIITPRDQADREAIAKNLEILEIHDKIFNMTRNNLLNLPFKSLHTLRLDGAMFGPLMPAPPTLRHFSVTSTSTRHLIDIYDFIRGAPDIETLAFNTPLIGVLDPTNEQTPALVLPRVESFRIERVNADVLSLFTVFQFPVLRELSIVQSPPALDAALSALETTALVSLTLDSCIVDADAILGLIRASPELETLALRRLVNGVINPVLETLIAESAQGVGRAIRNLDASGCQDLRTGPIMRLVSQKETALAQVEKETDTVDDPPAQPVPVLDSLRVSGCPLFESGQLPWLRQRIKLVECVYMTKKAAKARR